MKKFIYLIPIIGLIYAVSNPKKLKIRSNFFIEIFAILQSASILLLFFIMFAIFILWVW